MTAWSFGGFHALYPWTRPHRRQVGWLGGGGGGKDGGNSTPIRKKVGVKVLRKKWEC